MVITSTKAAHSTAGAATPADQTGVLQELKRLQRAYDLAPSFEPTASALEPGLESASSVVA